VLLNQFEQDVEPFLWLQIRIKPIVSNLSIFKTAKHLSDSFHAVNFTTPGTL